MRFFGALLLAVMPAWAGHTLAANQKSVLDAWLGKHPEYKVATDADCECAELIKGKRTGMGDAKEAVADYHPYVATGDFNRDGLIDFAVVLIGQTKAENRFTLAIFNNGAVEPNFLRSGLALKGKGLYYGPPATKPYYLWMGDFFSDDMETVRASGKSYKVIDPP
jgi:hypothetical protein